jgi:pimeloyl-ACP methyl ester carboxylesterase
MQGPVPDPAGRENAGWAKRTIRWSDKRISTSQGEIVIGHVVARRLPLLLLGPAIRSNYENLLLRLFAHEYSLIEIDLAELSTSGIRPDPGAFKETTKYAELALEVLESLGVERVVVLDWSADGGVGRELMTVFPGLVGLVVVETSQAQPEARIQNAFLPVDLAKALDGEKISTQASPRADYYLSEGGTPILQTTASDALALEDFVGEMELRAKQLSAEPPLWYGG